MAKSDYYDGNKHQSLNAEFVDISEFEIPSKNDLSPELMLFKSEKYKSLSEESKVVIDLIVNTPTELIGIITTPKGNISKKLVIKYLENIWKSKFIVNQVIEELTELVKSF